jgi:hypothetical protein
VAGVALIVVGLAVATGVVARVRSDVRGRVDLMG